MTTVRAIVSENKHAEGLTKFTGRVLDIAAAQVNVPEWIRSIRTWLELHAIDGTASGLSVTPFVEPIASFPKENGPNSWVPIDPDTGNPALTHIGKAFAVINDPKHLTQKVPPYSVAKFISILLKIEKNGLVSHKIFKKKYFNIFLKLKKNCFKFVPSPPKLRTNFYMSEILFFNIISIASVCLNGSVVKSG